VPISFQVKRWKNTLRDKSLDDIDIGSKGKNSLKKRIQKSKGKRKPPILKNKPISVMSQKEARELYDKLAPHLPLKVIRNICALLNKKRKKGQASEGYTNIVRNLWKNETNKLKLPPIWTQQEMRRALLNRGGYNSFRSPKKSKADYPSQLNRKNWQKNLATLMKAREGALVSQLLWTRGRRQNLKEECLSSTSSSPSADESETNENIYPLIKKDDCMSSDRRALHEGKCEMSLREEGEVLLNHLGDTLPTNIFLDLMEFLGTIGSTSSDRVNFLLPSLDKCVKSHLHLVVFKIADFLYVDTKDTNNEDRRIKNSLKQWDIVREKFARLLPVFQRTLLEKREQAPAKNQVEVKSIDLQIRKKEPAKKMTKCKEEKGKRKRRHYHVQFDAAMLTDTSPSVPDCEKMVFVDNLPIDISEIELIELYTRCGPIQSISIFNQRTDLDPGKLSGKQLKERKRKMRTNRISSLTSQRWQRPRTPVYGLITFATNKGSQLALDLHLKLFGMIVQKHAMRSLPVSDLNKLYVENIPQGVHSADLEYQLAKYLRGIDIHVSLELGQQKRQEPTSCEIAFPSFEVAFISQDIVKKSVNALAESIAEFREDDAKEDTPREAVVNWIKTPVDA